MSMSWLGSWIANTGTFNRFGSRTGFTRLTVLPDNVTAGIDNDDAVIYTRGCSRNTCRDSGTGNYGVSIAHSFGVI